MRVILRRLIPNTFELAAANAHDGHPDFIMKLRITFHLQRAVRALDPYDLVIQALAETLGQSSAAPQPQLSRPLDSFKLSIPRLLGVLGEPNPPFGHFDEKGFMRRSASFLRQPNGLSGVLA